MRDTMKYIEGIKPRHIEMNGTCTNHAVMFYFSAITSLNARISRQNHPHVKDPLDYLAEMVCCDINFNRDLCIRPYI